MSQSNNQPKRHLVRLTDKIQKLNKLLTEGADMDWVMDIFITTVVLAQDGVNDEFARN
jgi:hypothetical protein